MKKGIIILLATAALTAACTYETEVPSMRTSGNLASLNNEILASTVGAAAIVLSDYDSVYPDAILAPGFDTLVTQKAFTDRFGTYASEMSITNVADSTWIFLSTGTGSLFFTGTIIMTGRSSTDNIPIFDTDYNGTYDEGNGLTANFSSALLEITWKLTPVYVQGYGYMYQYYMSRKGDTRLTTYYNSVMIDDFKATYDGTDIKY